MKSPLDLVAEAKANIVEVSLDNARQACNSADVVIDVREPNEFIAGHLPNAINVPRGVLEFKINELENIIDAESNIVLYCKTSGRAALAAQSLKSLGFTNVLSILGGFDAWHNAGMPVDKPEEVNFG